MSMESPTRRSSVSGFSESLDGAGKRQKKLLMLQKKMQMSDAMEKRMQLEHFKASGTGGKGGRLSSEMMKSIGSELDKVLNNEDFRAPSASMCVDVAY
jgi:hypothetical protein